MAKLEFEYDETGDKFCYFILGFYILIILPLTYYLWPDWKKLKSRSSSQDKHSHPEDVLLNYSPCKYKQASIDDTSSSSHRRSVIFRTISIFFVWLLLFWLIAKTNQIQNEGNATDGLIFDPFEILGIDKSASETNIKSAYRKLILVHHPDKGGDENVFREITKAYKTLTDEQTRLNWEQYGNPDGPGVVRFGIALPKWIIEGRNAAMLIAVYTLIFIIGLPVAVGSWWYRSIKYTADKILVDTTHLYSMFLIKSPSMNVSRAIMVLSGSLEFERSHNNKIVERASDNEDIPSLMHILSVNINERTKERPLCFAYSVKARTLIYAYLCREKLTSEFLEKDQMYIISMCPMLIAEMAQISLQLMAIGRMGELSRSPTLETFEMLIRLSALLVHALEERKSPLCQLPHIFQQMRRIPAVSLKHLAQMTDIERSKMLKQLSEQEINDVLKVMSSMPLMDVSVKFEVLDDDIAQRDQITINSLVTATITLTRKPLYFDKSEVFDSTFDFRVFCPFFPDVKFEQWWIYLVDRKQRELVASVKHVCSLKESIHSFDDNGCPVSRSSIQLKFAAPSKAGVYVYQINVRSDSYIDLDVADVIKFEVINTKSDYMKNELQRSLSNESEDNETPSSDENESEDEDLDNEQPDNEEYMTESD